MHQKNKTPRIPMALVALVFTAFLTGITHVHGKPFFSQVQVEKKQATDTVGIEPELVCMVNNAFMGRQQIAVPVEGKTYYGCCQMCVGKLQNSQEVRVAQDPLTGEKVDKAEAFIVLKPNGNGEVLYFKSESNYLKYNSNFAN